MRFAVGESRSRIDAKTTTFARITVQDHAASRARPLAAELYWGIAGHAIIPILHEDFMNLLFGFIGDQRGRRRFVDRVDDDSGWIEHQDVAAGFRPDDPRR